MPCMRIGRFSVRLPISCRVARLSCWRWKKRMPLPICASLMGATNPANAEEGTIRKKWASSIEHNAIHGSDADDTARFELSFFFAGYELTK